MARAMRLSMIDRCMIIDVLFSRTKIQTIQRRFSALTVKHCEHVVPHERTTKRNGIRNKIAAALLLNMEVADMKCPLAFNLKFVILHDSVVAKHNLRDRICKVHIVPDGNMTFDKCT